MYARKIKFKIQRWNYIVQRDKYSFSSSCHDYSIGQCSIGALRAWNQNSLGGLVEKYLSKSPWSLGHPSERFLGRSDISWSSCSMLRFYSSEGDGRSASEDTTDNARNSDAHARLGEQDQLEWLRNEKLARESKESSPFLTRRERFRNEFLRRVVPWEKITVSWDTFPYYLRKHTKDLLVECTASHMRNKKLATDYGGLLNSSRGRILLQSIPGTELYRDRVVRALARDLQVPLLVLDSSVLGNQAISRGILFKWSTSGESRSSTASSNSKTTAEHSDKARRPLKKGDPVKYIGQPIVIAHQCDYLSCNDFLHVDNQRIVSGKDTNICWSNAYTVVHGRTISKGQRGEVYEVKGDQVAVILDSGKATKEGERDEKSAEPAAQPSLCWLHGIVETSKRSKKLLAFISDCKILHIRGLKAYLFQEKSDHYLPMLSSAVKDIKHDLDCYVAMEVLFEVLESQQPVIVYFPDSSLWLSRAVSKSNRKEFVRKLQEMFDRLSGPVVLICGQNKVAAKEKDKFPLPLRRLTEGLKATNQSGNVEIFKLFTNVVSLSPPKEEDLLRIFIKQIEEDRRIVLSRRNLYEMHKVLEMHGLSCMDLLHVNTDGLILTKQKAEKLVGWAKNHYLSSCLDHSVKGDRLQLPRDSLELAISRLKEEETGLREPSHSHDLKTLAEGEYEKNFISAVVPPGEIGVRFDDVGALEDVKKVLNELVILPMQRPELFSHGNLLQPCKGILLFGPPGTGKTLIAKALATEAGANFIYVTSSTLTSKWYGDEEKLAASLFSFASKLAPVIIFVDEVDSLLGARGDASEHEATRKLRNEFMASWDGLRSKDSQRILILGATNRPFDLDDAVIRRLPRRIYVDLPDAENRLKILKIILARENLVSGFSFEQLVNDTDGYSGSDLKNLCIAAAYRPVQELIEEEKNKNARFDGVPGLRPLSLDDFICSKAKVGPSVAYDSGSMNELRKWNDQYGEGGSRRKLPFGF